MQDTLTVGKSTKYPPGAFEFLRRGLDYTVSRLHGPPPTPPTPPTPFIGPGPSPGGGGGGGSGEGGVEALDRHVSGRDLCFGLRDFALEEYGLLARTVLKSWRLYSSADFGRVVYTLVDQGIWFKTEEDSFDDFIDVFSFAEAFPQVLELADDSREAEATQGAG